MNILFAANMPWKQTLGGVRPQLRIGPILESFGHTVQYFDFYDPTNPARFRKRLKNHIHNCCVSYDILDCHQSDYIDDSDLKSKSFSIALRSVGLHSYYRDYSLFSNPFAPDTRLKKVASFVRYLRLHFKSSYSTHLWHKSLRSASCINVTLDEHFYLKHVLSVQCPVHIIPFASDYSLDLISSDAINDKSKRILFVGNFSSRKGFPDLVHIYRYLRNNHPDYELVLGGTGVDDAFIYKFFGSSKGLRNIKSFASNETGLLFRDCKLGIFPSYMEGMPFAVLEMISHSLPVVVILVVLMIFLSLLPPHLLSNLVILKCCVKE